jgi:hypothetical protein
VREFMPQNRILTAALVAGLIALIIYGFVAQDSATGVILGVIVVFFAAPAAIVFFLNRRGRRDDEWPADE